MIRMLLNVAHGHNIKVLTKACKKEVCRASKLFHFIAAKPPQQTKSSRARDQPGWPVPAASVARFQVRPSKSKLFRSPANRFRKMKTKDHSEHK